MDLQQLKQRSYVPYSGNTESCVVESKTGRCFPGVRIENISFPLTIPAVQCGLFTCLSESEYPKILYTSNKDDSCYWQKEYDLEIKDLNLADEKEMTEIALNSTEINKVLRNLLDRSITTFSNFPVSAVLKTNYGLITGVNIESHAWESGLCAERVAMAKAIAYGISEIDALHICSRYGEYSSPCGACRQVILEHLPGHPVYIHHPDGTLSQHLTSDLMPFSFKSDFLKKR